MVRREVPERFSMRFPARILIVEDQPMNQKIVQMMLQKLGYDVRIAGNGREGVEMVNDGTTDLIFMDLQMPVMGGLEAVKAIRNPETGIGNPDIPVVAMTANATQEDKDECLNAGMNAFITKPVMMQDLQDVLKKWVPRFGC